MTAPQILKSWMPVVRIIEESLVANGYIKGTKEWTVAFDHSLAFYRKFVGIL
jgi:hypothetical protein